MCPAGRPASLQPEPADSATYLRAPLCGASLPEFFAFAILFCAPFCGKEKVVVTPWNQTAVACIALTATQLLTLTPFVSCYINFTSIKNKRWWAPFALSFLQLK